MVENIEIFNRVSKIARTVLASSLFFGVFLPQRAFAQEDDPEPIIISPSRETLYEYPIDEEGSVFVNVLRICRRDGTGEMQTLIRVSELKTKTALRLVAKLEGSNREVGSTELIHDPNVVKENNYRMEGPTLGMNQDYVLSVEEGPGRTARWSQRVKLVCRAALLTPVENEMRSVEEEPFIEDQEVAS